MKNTLVLDTNVILRYLLNDHPQQFQMAEAIMAKVISGEVTAYILDSVLAECVYVLLKVYKVPKPTVCAVLTELLNYAGISEINRIILQTGLKRFAEHQVDIVDCLVYSVAEFHHWELFSFDRDLKKFT